MGPLTTKGDEKLDCLKTHNRSVTHSLGTSSGVPQAHSKAGKDASRKSVSSALGCVVNMCFNVNPIKVINLLSFKKLHSILEQLGIASSHQPCPRSRILHIFISTCYCWLHFPTTLCNNHVAMQHILIHRMLSRDISGFFCFAWNFVIMTLRKKMLKEPY